jgi:hypothetical protein
VSTLTLDLCIIDQDIRHAECGNRARCLLALAIDRQFELGGKGYIRVDANEASFNFAGARWRWHLPKRAVKYLRAWDEAGEQLGVDAAREQFQPAQFELLLAASSPVSPQKTRARQDQINQARRRRDNAAKAAGQPHRKPALRYVGI